MRQVLMFCAALALAGCASTRVVELPVEQLRAQIAAGEILEPGMIADITTVDGRQQRLLVERIDAHRIVGSDSEIPIELIARLAVGKPTLVNKATGAAIGLGLGAMISMLITALVAAIAI